MPKSDESDFGWGREQTERVERANIESPALVVDKSRALLQS